MAGKRGLDVEVSPEGSPMKIPRLSSPELSFSSDSEDTGGSPTAPILYGPVFAATGVSGHRQYMVDAHCIATHISDPLHLFSVYDGHGVASYCTEHMAPQLAKQLSAGSGVEEAPRSTFGGINRQVTGCAIQGGSTAVVTLLSDTHIYMGHCGRCPHARRHGRAM